MILHKLKSSMVYAVGYSEEDSILEIVFRKGSIWAYEGVPKEVFDGLLLSGSPGSYVRDNILSCYDEYPIS
jgi:hypothetical protein